MDFDEYAKTGHIRYAELARTVASILKAAVKADPNLRLQHVQHRAKDPERLKTKLAKRSVAESDNMETAVKDLAGCRVVFYTNSHVSMFLNSGIVRKISMSIGKGQRSTTQSPMPTTQLSYLSRTTTS